MKFLLMVLVLTGLGVSLPTIIEGPIQWEGSDYYLLSNSTWTDAQAVAEGMGGNLATINTAEENTWVVNTFSPDGVKNLWIGFTDQDVEGVFVWTSGEPVTYTNWGQGNPDDQCGGQDYACIVGTIIPLFGPTYRGEWDDSDDDGYMPSNIYFGVVEIPFTGISTTSWGSIKALF